MYNNITVVETKIETYIFFVFCVNHTYIRKKLKTKNWLFTRFVRIIAENYDGRFFCRAHKLLYTLLLGYWFFSDNLPIPAIGI